MTFQKTYSKRYLLMVLEVGNIKMVLILLTKIVILYIQIIIVKVKILEFERPAIFISKAY